MALKEIASKPYYAFYEAINTDIIIKHTIITCIDNK